MSEISVIMSEESLRGLLCEAFQAGWEGFLDQRDDVVEQIIFAYHEKKKAIAREAEERQRKAKKQFVAAYSYKADYYSY